MTRSLPSTLAVAAVVALAAIVAGTSHASVWAPLRRGSADPSELITIVALAFSLCFATAGALWLASGRNPRWPWPTAIASSVTAAALLSLLAISTADLRVEATPGAERVDAPGRSGVRLESDWRGPATRRAAEADAEESLLANWDSARFARRLMLFVGAVALALLVLARWPGRRTGQAAAHVSLEPFGRTAAHGAVVTTIDAMLADPDPRTAIIGAYARLLEELEAIGASRREYEGPTEHLHRVLSVLEVHPAPLETLIRLFAVARFSEHLLTALHREGALTALRQVARDLAVPDDPVLRSRRAG